MPRCNVTTDYDEVRSWRELRPSLTDAQRAVVESTDLIHIDVVYWILHRNESENLPLAVLQSQHQMLNSCYNATNLNLAKVPDTGHYNFKSVVGNAGIVFLPSNHETLTEEQHVKRFAVNKTFDGYDSMVAEVTGELKQEFATNKLHIVCAPLSGSILGEAIVFGNITVCEVTAVGGHIVAGSASGYTLGITVVHEVGHCLGLPHVFRGEGNCSDTNIFAPSLPNPFTDIPLQIHPNEEFMLTNQGGIWTGSMCNRDRDCHVYRGDTAGYEYAPNTERLQPYSCMGCDSAIEPTCPNPGCCPDKCDGAATYEMGCNFLDYGVDDVLVMFSATQCQWMREVLIDGSIGITLTDSDGGTITSVPSSIAANIPLAGTDIATPAEEKTMFTPLMIALLSVGIAVMILAVALGLYFGLRRQNSTQ